MSRWKEDIPGESIIIGVPVRNEENSLISCLLSIREAITVSKADNIRLVICLNGCDDESEFIAQDFKAKYPRYSN